MNRPYFKSLLIISFLCFNSFSFGQNVRINEVMVQNDTSVADYVGKYEPWAEIYNPGNTSVNLTGYHLSVTPDYLLTWTFPSLTINPGQYIVVFFSKRHAI